jgi:hypothetical protein
MYKHVIRTALCEIMKSAMHAKGMHRQSVPIQKTTIRREELEEKRSGVKRWWMVGENNEEGIRKRWTRINKAAQDIGKVERESKCR